MKIMKYHNPVFLERSVECLVTDINGVYVDVTFGGGGHSRKILEKISIKGKLFAFDQDGDALKNKLIDARFKLIHSNFINLKKFLKFYGVKSVDGIIADFGVSSYQFDTKNRGFSIRLDGPLDMRMNRKTTLTAFHVVNEYSEKKLIQVLREYGEIKKSSKLVSKILESRRSNPIKTTGQLVRIIKKIIPSRFINKYAAQVFQAIRIEVNQELDFIKEMLKQSSELLRSNGRLVCITYHSLEDRIVKKYILDGVFDGLAITDIYGNRDVPLKKLGKFEIPTKEEIIVNTRSRSAKLRIAEKI